MSNEDLFNFDESNKIKGEFHDFTEHPEVIGILKEIKDGSYGKEFVIQTKEGKSSVIGSYTALIHKIPMETIGKAIKIVYKGSNKSKTSNRSYYDFDVYIK